MREKVLLGLLAYLGTVVLSHQRIQNHEAMSKSIRLTTAVSFGILAAALFFGAGGLQRWPNLLPLSLFFGGLFGALTLLEPWIIKAMSAAKKSRFESLSWVTAVLSFVSVAYYAMSPPEEGWMRPTGLGVFLVFALPLVFAVDALKRPDSGLLDMALTASELVYSKTRVNESTEFVQDRETGTRAAVSIVDDNVVVAFAGSENETDWLKTNINIASAEYHGTDVHKGFLKSWLAVKEDIFKLTDEFLNQTAAGGKLVVTGHSLGGAVATLAALDFQEKYQGESKVHVITFGAPHAGTANFASLYDATISYSDRVVTLYDPVPSLLGTHFTHVKTKRVITVPGLDNPATAHLLPTYRSALATPPWIIFVPALLVVFFLAIAALVPREHVEAFGKNVRQRLLVVRS